MGARTLIIILFNHVCFGRGRRFGMVGDLHIESNWADSGGCTFNFSHKGGTSLTLSATGNRRCQTHD